MGGDGGELPASFKECEAPMAETSISKQESEMKKKNYQKFIFFF